MPIQLSQENILTGALMGLCLALTVINLAPRLLVRTVAIEQIQSTITVSISGAIREPGVYELPWGTRLEDLVLKAGGLRADAEESLVNLAQPLDTGRSIFIPFYDTDEGDERISLNEASARELQFLPGVGEATAERIIDGRPYRSVEDLLKVSGIGPKTFSELEGYIKP